jgi:hypothetical protein
MRSKAGSSPTTPPSEITLMGAPISRMRYGAAPSATCAAPL